MIASCYNNNKFDNDKLSNNNISKFCIFYTTYINKVRGHKINYVLDNLILDFMILTL